MDTKNNSTQDNLGQLAEDTSALLEATADATEEAVVEARNRLKSALAAARSITANAGKKAVEGARATDQMIRENPYPALGVAFGVGALIGFLLSRRGRD